MTIFSSANFLEFNLIELDNPETFITEVLNILNLDGNYVGISLIFTKSNSSLTEDQLQGILLYSSKNDELEMEVFLKDKSKYKKLEELSGKIGYISTSVTQQIVKTFFLSSSVDVVFGVLYENLPNSNLDFESFSYRLREYAEAHNIEHPEFKIADKQYCNWQCPHWEGVCVATETGGHEQWHCSYCAARMAEDVIQENDTDFTANFDALYDTREWLLSSSKGSTYVDWFYHLGGYIQGRLTLTQALEAIDIYNDDLMPIISLLLSNPSSSQILYDNVQRDRFLSFLNSLASLNSDPTFQALLNNIKSDVIFYAGKTVAQVSSDF